MNGKSMLVGVSLMVAPAVVAGKAAISGQEKYSLKIPNGLAFSEFKGYES
jgi:hypothetical protein